MNQETLRENALLSPDPVSGKGIWRACLIVADVQGSSGYYPGDVLARDGASAFPAGTHIYFDHPTQSEEVERPERSVREMAGVLLDDARFEESPDGKGLFARVKFFEDVKDMIGFRAEHVGLSIRAAGQIEETPQGQRIVRSITHGLSVDLVTRAGAGGRLVSMTESKTENTGAGTAATSSQSVVSNNDTGTLTAEVVALRESYEAKMDRFTLAMTNLTQVLKERQKEQERQLQEALSVGKVVAKLMGADDLPNSSRARLAENYRPGQDLDESIRKERDYLRSVMRESGKTLNKPESSGLGLTESASTTTSQHSSGVDDLSAIEELLNDQTGLRAYGV